MIWATIPTAGRESLAGTVESCGLPHDRIVVVRTRPDAVVPQGCRTVDDFGPANIHRWWNRGIDECVAHGARYVAVLNDDVVLDKRTLPALLTAMQRHGATLASPGRGQYIRGGRRSQEMAVVGSCWLLDALHGLRPDERYRWWYGDNELDWRARTDYHGIATAPVAFTHLTPNELTDADPELLALTRADARTWNGAR